MPWQEQSVMDQRIEFVKLATADNANVRALCRRFKVSPDVGYKWIAATGTAASPLWRIAPAVRTPRRGAPPMPSSSR